MSVPDSESGDLPFKETPMANNANAILGTLNLLKCVPVIGGGQRKMHRTLAYVRYVYKHDCSDGVFGVYICSGSSSWTHTQYDIKYLCVSCTLVNLLKIKFK